MIVYCSFSTVSNAEMAAQDLVEQGEIDQAIAIYQQLQPPSARIFHAIGTLYTNKIGNYELAISCFEEALHIQEKVSRSSFPLNKEIKYKRIFLSRMVRMPVTVSLDLDLLIKIFVNLN